MFTVEDEPFDGIDGDRPLSPPQIALPLERNAHGSRPVEFFYSRQGVGLIDEIPQFRILAAAELIEGGPFPQEMIEKRRPGIPVIEKGFLHFPVLRAKGFPPGAGLAFLQLPVIGFIKEKFDPSDLRGKRACKADLQQEFYLKADPDIPLLGMISRLTDQKGFDILAPIIEPILNRGVQFILLGTGEEEYHLLFQKIGQKFPQKAGIRIAFDNTLAHKIEAGADMFLMPSLYEPCGLNQVYSLKYGTVPIVRATGGLDDTIRDFNPLTEEGTGFKFKEYKSSCLLEAVERALQVYKNRAVWEKLMARGMAEDFSWELAACEYVRVYEKSLDKKKAPKAEP